MNPVSVDVKSPKLATLALGIVATHKTGQALGLRPFTIGMKSGDIPELRTFAIRSASLAGLNESVVLCTAEDFEKSSRRGSDPGVAVVIVDGQNLSKAVQVRMVAHGLPGLITIPPIFIVAIPTDPGDLVRQDRWALPFRAIFQRHWQWPTIGERKGDWTKLFRSGVEYAAQREELPVPEIEASALKMVKALPIQDEDGSRSLIHLGIKSFHAMRKSDARSIRSPHVLVSLPGTSSPPPAQEEQQQASAG